MKIVVDQMMMIVLALVMRNEADKMVMMTVLESVVMEIIMGATVQIATVQIAKVWKAILQLIIRKG